jgi:hypothetical protein
MKDKKTKKDYSIRVIQKFEEIERIREFWEKQQWHPYTDMNYYLRFASAHKGFIRPHVMLLSRDGHPKTLMIGWIQNNGFNWKIGYKTIFRPKERCLHIEYAGVLGDTSSSNCAALIEEIQNCLKRGEADFAYFKFIRHESAVFKVAVEMPSFLCRDHFPFINPHWTLSLPSSFDEFYRSRSKSMKKSVRLIRNRIEKKYKGKIKIQCYKLKSDVDRAMKDVEAIAAKTYQRGLGAGFYSTPEGRQEWSYAAERKWLRVYILYLDEEPCAFFTGYSYGNRYHLETTGFDRAYNFYSPGTYLLIRIIEDLCFNEKISFLDFSYGDADYKRKYCNQKWNDVGVFVFASTLKGIKLNIIRCLIAAIDKNAKTILDRFKILSWVKKKWRQRLIPSYE